MSLQQTVLLMGAMFLAKGVDWEVDGRVAQLRVAWAASQLAAVAALALVYRAIAAQRDSPAAKKTLQVPRQPSMSDPQVRHRRPRVVTSAPPRALTAVGGGGRSRAAPTP